MASVIFRAKTLGFINQGQNEYLWRQMSSRGYRLNEPIQLDLNGEKPTLLAEIFDHLKQELGYDNNEISSVFSLNYSEILNMYHLKQPNILRLV